LESSRFALHDKKGKVGTLQNDAGLGNLTVPDFSLKSAQELWLDAIQNATSTGLIDGIFADKAVKNANKNQVCNHGCIDLTEEKAAACAEGHIGVVREGHSQLGKGIMMRKAGSLVGYESDASVYSEWSSHPMLQMLKRFSACVSKFLATFLLMLARSAMRTQLLHSSWSWMKECICSVSNGLKTFQSLSVMQMHQLRCLVASTPGASNQAPQQRGIPKLGKDP